ncbi:MAG: Holliday junction resolvase RuvX [Parcubacteria group bacterium]|nr:Holliday junction resolvase RuvX [Parcubacteria group bacterium]
MLLGIDYGTKRMGLALGDRETQLALPFKTLLNDNSFFDLLREVCRSEDVEKIIVGIPLPLRGGENEQVRRVKEFIEKLKKELGISVDMVDERFTSHEVRSRFAESKKEYKKVDKDSVAAAIILQSYLDKK